MLPLAHTSPRLWAGSLGGDLGLQCCPRRVGGIGAPDLPPLLCMLPPPPNASAGFLIGFRFFLEAPSDRVAREPSLYLGPECAKGTPLPKLLLKLCASGLRIMRDSNRGESQPQIRDFFRSTHVNCGRVHRAALGGPRNSGLRGRGLR